VVQLGRLRSSAIDSPASGGAPLPPEPAPCTNCGAGPVGEYCAACGQRHVTPQHFTARAFFHELLGEFVSLDGRFWLTLWTLVRHPGKLAREYFDGRGARYMRPLNLFLLLNLVFFLIQPHTGLLQWHLKAYLKGVRVAPELVERKRVERAQEVERDREARGEAPRPLQLESMEIFESSFEATIQDLKKSMLLVAIPIFAVAIAMLYGTRHRFAEHLIFSTHFFAFSVFALTVLVPLIFKAMVGWLILVRAPNTVDRALSTESALTVVLFALLGTYLYVGLRRMYGDSAITGAGRAVALFAAYEGIVVLFSSAMFRVTLWAM
jgi:hypothetical protein